METQLGSNTTTPCMEKYQSREMKTEEDFHSRSYLGDDSPQVPPISP